VLFLIFPGTSGSGIRGIWCGSGVGKGMRDFGASDLSIREKGGLRDRRGLRDKCGPRVDRGGGEGRREISPVDSSIERGVELRWNTCGLGMESYHSLRMREDHRRGMDDWGTSSVILIDSLLLDRTERLDRRIFFTTKSITHFRPLSDVKCDLISARLLNYV
jgi:hypothetical protein